MDLSEAEIQVLASLKEADSHNQPTDRATLEKRAERYWIFLEDWSDAFSSLVDKGLLRGDESCFSLTESGRPLAAVYYKERDDFYWYYYQRFYSVAHESEAYSRFCERVYGKDLCQEGQADMACFNDILNRLDVKPGGRVLDLGCGAGGLSEYVADSTGAIVTGIDNSTSAIETANARTEGKRDKLTFIKADLNALKLPEHSFDAAISIDSINFVVGKVDAIASFIRAIKPGGKLCILLTQRINEGDHPDVLEVDKTPVALALAALNLNFETHDYTASFFQFWPLAKKTAETLREDFVRDGAVFICDAWVMQAKTFLRAINADEIKRYLYHIHV